MDICVHISRASIKVPIGLLALWVEASRRLKGWAAGETVLCDPPEICAGVPYEYRRDESDSAMVIERDEFRIGYEIALDRSDNNTFSQDDSEFLISITYSGDLMGLRAAGRLDGPAARRFREAIELCIESNPTSIRIDAGDVHGMGLPGVIALADGVLMCAKQDVNVVELQMSEAACNALDRAGLWWLGVVDDPPRLEKAIREARSIYIAAALDLEAIDGNVRRARGA